MFQHQLRPEFGSPRVMQPPGDASTGRSGRNLHTGLVDVLLKRAVDQDDFHVALALHTFLDTAGRTLLGDLLFGSRRRVAISRSNLSPAL